MLLPPKPVSSYQGQRASGQVAFTWSNPPDSDFIGVIIVRAEDTTEWKPDNGYSYEDEQVVQTGHVVKHKGAETSYTDTGLTNSKKYHYTIYAFDEGNNYSDGLSLSFDPFVP